MFCRQFVYLTLSSVRWNQGLSFAKFFTPWSCFHYVLWLQSRSCFTTIFCYLTLSSVCWNQGLNFAKVFTPWSCLRGVRQGCILSSLLFNLYVNDLPSAFQNTLSDPIILPDGTKLNSLSYANDLIILQRDYRIVSTLCRVWT